MKIGMPTASYSTPPIGSRQARDLILQRSMFKTERHAGK
jgi:hypothetical protein